MSYHNPDKRLGQHYLKDHNIARKIVSSLSGSCPYVLEIGAGYGILTRYIIQQVPFMKVIEIDNEAVEHLKSLFLESPDHIIQADFLEFDIGGLFDGEFAVIGNFPYNISSQIFFKILDQRRVVREVVCMVQKEVAERIASKPGTKKYGILSVLLQRYYMVEYLFTVNENVFNPPPKVKSAVIRLTRLNESQVEPDYTFYKLLIKTAFNQRRKVLRNSLKSLESSPAVPEKYANMRPEDLSPADFVELAELLSAPV